MAAAQLQHDHNHWLVIWGCYTRTYIAFPLFAAPRGTILIAAAPADMAAKMRRQERSAGVRVPQPSPPPDWRGAADWQNAQDWPGRHSLRRTR
jgi:hypothetical protein